jgi:DNA-binding transcriptional LysR family regulator
VAVFARVVEEGGFTAAARVLGLPKSSVSRSVALLEDEVGARLLRRSTRKVSTTEAGTAFYERASRGLAAVADAREAAVDLDRNVHGLVRITAPVDAGVWLLAPIVSAFVERYPDVHVETVLTSRIVDLVEEGFDLALRAGRAVDESLVERKLTPHHLALYASRAYLQQSGAPRTVAELASHRAVLFRAARGRATWTLAGTGGEQSVDVQGAVSADDFSYVLEAVIAGAGIGMLPTFVTTTAGRRIVRVLPQWSADSASLRVVHPPSRYMPRRVLVFRDFLIDSLQRRTD